MNEVGTGPLGRSASLAKEFCRPQCIARRAVRAQRVVQSRFILAAPGAAALGKR